VGTKDMILMYTNMRDRKSGMEGGVHGHKLNVSMASHYSSLI